MAGRPKKEDSRDNQYRVRLNDNENEMLEYVSKMNEKKTKGGGGRCFGLNHIFFSRILNGKNRFFFSVFQ